jgi:2-polyprenyl-6-methoxyphenol hydroxylase-like FAD-dependent oxidoreductase
MATSAKDLNQFKVLIAGGSLVGLGLALAFERAGIDYELFEKGEFAPQLGASIGIHPHTIRILEQLGVWSDIEKQVVPLQNRNHYDENGRCFEESHVLEHIQKMYVFHEHFCRMGK